MTKRIALVHDWLTGMRGGEKVLEVFCELFPAAPIYTLLHNKGSVSSTIESHPIITSFIQRLPGAASGYRNYLALFPAAVKGLDTSGYDIIISTSHCVAKGIPKQSGALHICYCFTPMRYAWLFFNEYFGRHNTAVKKAIGVVLNYLKKWDLARNKDVDYFVAISNHVKDRIRKFYHRDAGMIYPPVETHRFRADQERDDYYLLVSALAPYKKVDLAIEAFNQLKRPLIIIGTGPDEQRLKKIAAPHITFKGHQSDEQIAVQYSRCKAFIFPQEEDFGITPLEAQASGAPVIAFRKGGVLETVQEKRTGIFFNEQTAGSLCDAVEYFEKQQLLNPEDIRKSVERFDRSIFKEKMRKLVEEKWHIKKTL